VLIVKAALCLHNFLRQTNSAGYCPDGFCDSEDRSKEIKPGQWRKEVSREGSGSMSGIAPLRGRRKSNSAIALSTDDVTMMHYGIEMRTSQAQNTC
jgi:hypothetical protein